MYQMLWSWAKRRHPKKPARWIKARYFRTIDRQKWVFAADTMNKRRGQNVAVPARGCTAAYRRHVLVKGTASPMDPSLARYWGERRKRLVEARYAEANRLRNLYACSVVDAGVSRQPLLNGEALDTHHLQRVTDGKAPMRGPTSRCDTRLATTTLTETNGGTSDACQPSPRMSRRGSRRFGGGSGRADHYAVDGGKARIILEALVTPADVMENQPFLDMLWRACFRWGIRPNQVTGDTAYGTVENIVGVEDQRIHAYVPLPDFDQRTPFYGASKFTYDPERDEYRCPQDHPLRRSHAKYTEGVVVYQAEAATCNACPMKAACTESSQGRQVRRSLYAEYLDRVRAYHETPAYEKAMAKRKVWVEPLFGEAKDWHGLERFRLRRLWKVNIEALLIATGQNLKRLLRKRGWGRRPWPNGAPEAPFARRFLAQPPRWSPSLV